jgi:hypothetical protein
MFLRDVHVAIQLNIDIHTNSPVGPLTFITTKESCLAVMWREAKLRTTPFYSTARHTTGLPKLHASVSQTPCLSIVLVDSHSAGQETPRHWIPVSSTLLQCSHFSSLRLGAGVAQSVYLIVYTTDWTTGVRSPAEAKDFSSSLCVQISSEEHTASYPMGTGGLFPG